MIDVSPIAHSGKPVMLDLFCGLGGASQVMRERGWRVVSVDIEKRFNPTIVADVLNLPLKPFHVDLLWASPVCTDFAKWGLRCFYPNPPEPDLSQALAVKAIINEWKPSAWIVENVWASRPWLSKIFGRVLALLPGHALWGNLPCLFPQIEPHKGNYRRHLGSRYDKHKRRYVSDGPHGSSIIPHTDWWAKRGKSFVGTGHNGTSPQEAALIPREISEAVCLSVERRMGYSHD